MLKLALIISSLITFSNIALAKDYSAAIEMASQARTTLYAASVKNTAAIRKAAIEGNATRLNALKLERVAINRCYDEVFQNELDANSNEPECVGNYR